MHTTRIGAGCITHRLENRKIFPEAFNLSISVADTGVRRRNEKKKTNDNDDNNNNNNNNNNNKSTIWLHNNTSRRQRRDAANLAVVIGPSNCCICVPLPATPSNCLSIYQQRRRRRRRRRRRLSCPIQTKAHTIRNATCQVILSLSARMAAFVLHHPRKKFHQNTAKTSSLLPVTRSPAAYPPSPPPTTHTHFRYVFTRQNRIFHRLAA